MPSSLSHLVEKDRMNTRRKTACAKIALYLIIGLFGLCGILSAVSAYANSRMPAQSAVLDRLTGADKARLAEVYHLRQALGDAIIPGWSKADIPLILYNERYVFLVGYPNPPDGWEKVPNGPHRGGPWEPVPGDAFQGEPYYRQAYPGPDQQPESFTVRVGDRWVAALTTLDWFKIQLANYMRADLPAPLKPLFPYPLVVNMTMGSSEQYISLIHHEAAHAYQGLRAPARLAEGERASLALGNRYPYDDKEFAADWQAELDCLHDAVRAGTAADTRALAVRFLELRRSRRASANLTDEMVGLERKREWEEGFAKYVEMNTYSMAGNPRLYGSLSEIQDDPQFHNYRDRKQRWEYEVNQISTIARQNDEIRFYYSGWAQSELLDRLAPGWKARYFDGGVWLEDLLAGAVE